ncbi:MAG: hypothetical protein AAB349_02860, partial [Chloroflexota bacterium]
MRLSKDNVTLRVERDELALLVAALNEVCNGVHIGDAEFETRLGFTRAEARELLARLSDVSSGSGLNPAPALLAN